ncbi:MAG: sigma-54-dependent Fis family transcriptional regulator [Planctomycetia bacterium]|nr:sigma-54-dependent Fis family transcriptional regulator [Planctomycetia bacterium]
MSHQYNLLIVSGKADNEDYRQKHRELIAAGGLAARLQFCSSGAAARELIRGPKSGQFDALVVDWGLGGEPSGPQLVSDLGGDDSMPLPVAILDDALPHVYAKVIQYPVVACIRWPPEAGSYVQAIRDAVNSDLRANITRLKAAMHTRHPGMVARLIRVARALMRGSPDFLLLGASGTGKGYLAEVIHRLRIAAGKGGFCHFQIGKVRREFILSDLCGTCKGAFTGAIDREGWIEKAHGGTLFLDEIGELGLDEQICLLDLLNEGSFNRVGSTERKRFEGCIIAATHRNLTVELEVGRLRRDLFNRLEKCTVVHLPSVEERKRHDLELLVASLLKKYESTASVSDEAMKFLRDRTLAGNLHELDGLIRRAIPHGDTVYEYHLGHEVNDMSASATTTLVDGRLNELVGMIQEVLNSDELPWNKYPAWNDFTNACGEKVREIVKSAFLEKAGGNASLAGRLLRTDRKRFPDTPRTGNT